MAFFTFEGSSILLTSSTFKRICHISIYLIKCICFVQRCTKRHLDNFNYSLGSKSNWSFYIIATKKNTISNKIIIRPTGIKKKKKRKLQGARVKDFNLRRCFHLKIYPNRIAENINTEVLKSLN